MRLLSRGLCALGRALGTMLEPPVVLFFECVTLAALLYLAIRRERRLDRERARRAEEWRDRNFRQP